MIVAVALFVGVLLGVGCTLWLAHPAPRPATSVVPTSPQDAAGHFRVTRERNGQVVDVLHQGGGARAAQLYAYHNPTQDGEVIAFYRGSERCSAKGAV